MSEILQILEEIQALETLSASLRARLNAIMHECRRRRRTVSVA